MNILYCMTEINSNGSEHFSKYAANHFEFTAKQRYKDVVFDIIDVRSPSADLLDHYDLVVMQDVGGMNLLHLDSLATDLQAACKVLYAVDPHGKFGYIDQFAAEYNVIYSAVKDFVGRFTGTPWQYWLPLAIAPEQHKLVSTMENPPYDIAFIGRCGDKTPRWYALAQLYNICEKNNLKLLLTEAWGDDYLEVCRQFKIAFNFNVADDLNFRTFEMMAMGKPLMLDKNNNGSQYLFRDMEHVRFYTPQSMESVLVDMIQNPVATDHLAIEGRNLVLDKHTWTHRFTEILGYYDRNWGGNV